MPNYVSGKYAAFVCDMCGFSYPYLRRRKTSYGTIVCEECYDGAFDLLNHPQNQAPPISDDPEGLEDARPDVVLVTTGDATWTPSMTLIR